VFTLIKHAEHAKHAEQYRKNAFSCNLCAIMNAIPAELLTLGSSTLLGSLFKFIGMFLDAQRQRKALELQAMSSRFRQVEKARTYTNPHFQWTRRAIALLCVFFVIAFPKIIAVFFPEIPVVIGYTEMSKGFLFFEGSAKTVWQTAHGLVITPLDTHLLAAIVGLYFGGSLAQH